MLLLIYHAAGALISQTPAPWEDISLAESPHLCSFAKCFSHLSSLATLVFHSLTACLSVDIYMHGPKCMWKVRKTFIDPVSDNPSKLKVVKRTMLYCIYWFPVVGKRKEWLLFMPNFAAGALNRIMYFIALKTQSTHCCEKCLFELCDDQIRGFYFVHICPINIRIALCSKTKFVPPPNEKSPVYQHLMIHA